MNASRTHTDGEHHTGDTTVVQRGVVVTSTDALTATELSAAIYLIRNQDKPEGEWDDLPAGITTDDVVLAISRQRARINATRAATHAYRVPLSTPLPKSEHVPADQQIDRSEEFTSRVPFWFGIVLIVCVLLAVWGLFDIGCRLWGGLW